MLDDSLFLCHPQSQISSEIQELHDTCKEVVWMFMQKVPWFIMTNMQSRIEFYQEILVVWVYLNSSNLNMKAWILK